MSFSLRTYAAGERTFARRRLARSLIAELMCALLGATLIPCVQAAEETDPEANQPPLFDSNFLRGLGQNIDLSSFSEAGTIIPGAYTLDITLNAKDRMRQSVQVVTEEGRQRLCFAPADVQRWKAKLELLPDHDKVAKLLASDCIEADQLIPGASFTMDVTELTGTLSIPQAYTGQAKRGYVDPAEWDQGINAVILGYHAHAFHNEHDGQAPSTDVNINSNAGLNLGGWRLRHNGNFQDGDYSQASYISQNSYAQTDVDSLQSQLTLGEYFTPGNDFDSIPFTGIQLASDDRMLPESERGFAPVIRGTAETNARVTVRQSGNLVYETSVAPGAFVIDDLYATGYAGDLEVTITEADGRVKNLTVPFASVVQMLRPEASRFNLAAGYYRDTSLQDAPWLMQGTYRRGISNRLTLYSGGLLADDYASALGGAAFATPLGALALDAAFSRAKGLPAGGRKLPKNGDMTGQSYRVSYSKLLDTSRTNVSLAAYRFSSEEFLSFGNFAHQRESDDSAPQRERNRFQLSISQPMGSLGDLNITGLRRNYWSDQPSVTTYQLGYSKSVGWGSLGVSASRVLQDGGASNTLMLTASIPIGSGRQRPLLSTTATFDRDHNNTLRTNLSGSLGKYSALSYGLYGSRSHNKGASSNTVGGNLNYRTSAAQLGANYSQGKDYRQYSASASGTLVAHAGGLITSPERGETMALMVADGAPGAALTNGQGNQLDGDGEALKAGLTPYQQNTLGISPRGLPMDVELEITSQNTVPRRGALVRLDFKTTLGKPLLLRLTDSQIPFGAAVLDKDGKRVALVGQGGLIFLRGEHPGLRVVWGQQSDESCQLRYQMMLTSETSDNQYQQLDARCVPS
ncbi:MAG: fimbria/pilus outer membrane usher protein [Aeromonas sobria]